MPPRRMAGVPPAAQALTVRWGTMAKLVTGLGAFGFLSASALAILLGAAAWESRSAAFALLSAVTALQATCVLRGTLRRLVRRKLLALLAVWSILSGLMIHGSTLSYIGHHGLDGWVGAAGVSGVMDETGRFHTFTPPLGLAALTAHIILGLGQDVSAVVLWIWRSKRMRRSAQLSSA